MFNIICYCSMVTVVCVWYVLPRSLFGASCRVILYLCHAFLCQVATARLELEALAGWCAATYCCFFCFCSCFVPWVWFPLNDRAFGRRVCQHCYHEGWKHDWRCRNENGAFSVHMVDNCHNASTLCEHSH